MNMGHLCKYDNKHNINIAAKSFVLPRPFVSLYNQRIENGKKKYDIFWGRGRSDEYFKDYVRLSDVESEVNNNELYEETDGVDYSQKYLTFEILSSGNITWKCDVGYYTGSPSISYATIQYKKNDGAWTNITSSKTGSSISVSTGDKIQFKGNRQAYRYVGGQYRVGSKYVNIYITNHFSTTCSFNLSGNIMSLISDNLNLKTLSTSETFYNLFYGCTRLISAKNLILPATTLSYGCYMFMFSQCTNLTIPPELPATVLTNYCYASMFSGCSSLTTAPKLPATTLATSCYSTMFKDCANLTCIKCNAENININNAGNWTDNLPINGTLITKQNANIDLMSVPTNWIVNDKENSGFSVYTHKVNINQSEQIIKIRIFNTDCKVINVSTSNNWIRLSNKKIVNIGLNTLYISVSETNNYRTGTITLSANGHTEQVIINQDNACESFLTFDILSDGNIIWKTELASFTTTIEYKKNDDSWVSITSSTSGANISVNRGDKILFKANNLSYSTYTYSGNKSNYFSSTCEFSISGRIMSLINENNYKYDFPVTINDDEPEIYRSRWEGECSHMFRKLFNNCTNLISCSRLYLQSKYLNKYCYESMFEGCTSLIDTPDFPADRLIEGCYNAMFKGCTSLTSVADLNAVDIYGSDYTYQYDDDYYNESNTDTIAHDYIFSSMFEGCTSLANPPKILFTGDNDNSCYHMFNAMFKGCTSLISAPILNAINPGSGGCASMFEGCTSLIHVENALSRIRYSGESTYACMFKGCTSLVKAPKVPSTDSLDPYLSSNRYASMFEGCTLLSDISNIPQIPSATPNACGGSHVFYCMFKNCTSLTAAPDILFTDMEDELECMFEGCTSLSYVKCLCVNDTNYYGYEETISFYNWLLNVSPTGTFVKTNNPNAKPWSSGPSGIPTGWVVQTVE